MSSIIASLFSSFVPTIHADAPSDQGQPPSDQGQSPSDQIQPAEEQLPSDQKRPTEEEEEEEEEDVRVSNALHNYPFPKHSFLKPYSPTLTFARNVKRQQNALL